MTNTTEAPLKCQLHMHCGGYCESERGIKRQFCPQCLDINDQHWSGAKGDVMVFGYTNYRGEYSERRATPIRFEFSSTEQHPEQQWLMHAIDHDKGAMRAFALKDMVWGSRF